MPSPQRDHLTYRTSPSHPERDAQVPRTKGSRGLALVRAHDKSDDQGATDGAALGAHELRVQKAHSGPAVLSRRGPRPRRCRSGGGPGAGDRPSRYSRSEARSRTRSRPRGNLKLQIGEKSSPSFPRFPCLARGPGLLRRVQGGFQAQVAIQESPPRRSKAPEGEGALAS